MNKSIIAIAIAAVTAAPIAANAAGTVYAQVQAEITQADNGTDSGLRMDDNARGRIGYKGSQELGNGMTMIGKMEYKMDTADGDSDTAAGSGIALTKREMLVGLKQGWGTFTMGRLKSPYKYAGGVKYDAFVTTALEARDDIMTGKVGTGKAMGHNGFQSDSIGVSAMGGKVYLTYGVDEADPTVDTDGNFGDLTVSYKHKMGKKNELVFAHVAQGDAGDYSATKVAGKFGAVKFQVELTDDGTAAGSDTYIFAAYGMKMAGGKLIVQGGNADGDNYVDGTTSVVVGFQKKFTKKARWFAGIKSNSGDDETQNITYGMRFDY